MSPAPVFRVLRKAARLGPLDWLDLLRAAHELARARHNFARLSPHDLVGPAPYPVVPAVSEFEVLYIGRVSRAVTRMAAYVPWRSDCLVQAIAARRWLARAGIGATIGIGVRRDDQFAAHAWLRAGPIIVTGGDISDFVPLPLDSATARLMDPQMRLGRFPAL